MKGNRRKATAEIVRKQHEDDFYSSYLAHLPKVDCPDISKPGVSYAIFFHDDWCAIYTDARTCSCDPDVEYLSHL